MTCKWLSLEPVGAVVAAVVFAPVAAVVAGPGVAGYVGLSEPAGC